MYEQNKMSSYNLRINHLQSHKPKSQVHSAIKKNIIMIKNLTILESNKSVNLSLILSPVGAIIISGTTFPIVYSGHSSPSHLQIKSKCILTNTQYTFAIVIACNHYISSIVSCHLTIYCLTYL